MYKTKYSDSVALFFSCTYIGCPLTPNLTITEVALSSFSITWDTFSHDACGVLTYNVRLFNGIQFITENVTTDNSITFTGLNNTSLYIVSVFATNNAGQGSTISVNVTTLTPTGTLYM